MESLIERIPIKENYKLMHEDYVRLKGPPNIARFCFIVEVAVAAAAFAISFWLTITSYTTETKITFEPLGSSYSCGVLSPRSDTEQFSTVSSELAQYSSARFELDTCLAILDTTGLNVCADGNRKDAVLSVQGLAATDDECIDMPIFLNYRFCHSSEVNTQLRPDLSDSYPRQTSGAPALTYSNTFYFMNQSGTAHSLVAEFDESNIKSQYYEYDNCLYVAARNEEDKMYVHLLSPDQTEAVELIEVLGSSLGGIAVGNSAVIAAEVGTGKVTLRIYNLTTETQQVKDIICETNTLQSNTIYSLLSIGSDGYLYLVCNTAVSRDSLHEIFKLDMINFSPEILYADIGNVAVVNDDDDDDAPQSFVNQLISMVVIEDNAYLSTGSPNYNLLRVNLTDGSFIPTPAPTTAPTLAGPPTSPGPLAVTSTSNNDQLISLAGSIARRLLVNTLTTAVLHVTGYNNTDLATSVLQVVSEHTKLQEVDKRSSLSRPRRRLDQREYSVETVGVYSGTYLHNIDNSYIYFEDSNQTIFDISTQTFTQLSTTLPQYYLATAVQLSYSYGICNGVVVSNWTVSAARDTAFYSLCDNINGIYYQNNEFFTVPDACKGMYSSTAEVTTASLSTCSALYTIATNFTTTNCANSFEDVCEAEYTNNPPFTCTTTITPDFLTTLGSSLANASALWSFLTIVISLSLKRIYPGGIFWKEYNEKLAQQKLLASMQSSSSEGGTVGIPRVKSTAVYPINSEQMAITEAQEMQEQDLEHQR